MKIRKNIKFTNSVIPFLVIIILSFLHLSCEKTIHMDIKNERRRIVVNGFLNTQQPVQVNISRSQHILDNAPVFYIPDASVFLFKNDIIIDTLTYAQDGDYVSHNYFPETGANYTLKVSAEGLEDIEATDYIPQEVPIISIDTSTVMYSGNGGPFGGVSGESREMLRCKITFQDPAGIQNFYQLQVINTYNSAYNGYTMYFETDDNAINDYITDYGAFFNDELFEGKTHEMNIYIEKFYKSSTLYFMLFSTSKSYSMYFRTIASFQQNGGGPFSEPVLVYNNITNGLGIFAGYSISVRPLYLGKK